MDALRCEFRAAIVTIVLLLATRARAQDEPAGANGAREVYVTIGSTAALAGDLALTIYDGVQFAMEKRPSSFVAGVEIALFTPACALLLNASTYDGLTMRNTALGVGLWSGAIAVHGIVSAIWILAADSPAELQPVVVNRRPGVVPLWFSGGGGLGVAGRF